MIIGYGRVSSKDQNLARQIKELEEYGCEYIFKEKISGKNFNRPVYQDMKKKLGMGNVLVVHSLSRFGRNKEEIMAEWKSLVDAKVDIVVLDMPILNTLQYREIEGIGELISQIFLQVMAWSVERDRKDNKIAQRQGIEIAKKEGKYKGRPIQYRIDTPIAKDRIIYEEIVSRLKQGHSVMDVHKYTGVSRTTIYGIRDQLKAETDI